jgi:hypothetical protein
MEEKNMEMDMDKERKKRQAQDERGESKKIPREERERE